MCGIVAAISNHDVSAILMEGLKRLEYRGYDSAGIAFLNGGIHRLRKPGKVKELQTLLDANPCQSHIGIAHTRWATHGVPDEANAHPHISGDRVVIVHNGIIENYKTLKAQQLKSGFTFESETDTEVIAHQIMLHLRSEGDLLQAVSLACRDLKGAYALAVLDSEDPTRLIAARKGSPLVLGIGEDGNYVSSDAQAIAPVTQSFIHLENEEIAVLSRDHYQLYDLTLKALERAPVHISLAADAAELGEFEHYMHKEIHEQPRAVLDTLEGRLFENTIPDGILGNVDEALLAGVDTMHIVACGSSYHAALVAKYWFENLVGIPCPVEIASEFRYCRQTTPKKALFVAISQSGETADTLAALELAKTRPYLATLAICNVPQSSLVRESDLTLMTHAGPEIGVASTKAFIVQLVALLLLVVLVGKRHGLSAALEGDIVRQLRHLPTCLEAALALEPQIKRLAKQYANKEHALFLGRGAHYPIALEGALKMKEISYIHAEAYPAGELKHGPLALVDEDMPVIAVAPNDPLLAKLRGNLEEVRARGGILHVFTDQATAFSEDEAAIDTLIKLDTPEAIIAPIVFTLPLQLLAYHTALIKGTDIDKPRNLAKSVTVE